MRRRKRRNFIPRLCFGLRLQLASGLLGMITTRRVSEGRMREDVASDVTPSLAYASGCDCYENRNFRRQRGELTASPRSDPWTLINSQLH
jgi:hypothetical protein